MKETIKAFVDNGLIWLEQNDLLTSPDPNMPSDMVDETGKFTNDWKPWKAIPSVVTDSDLNEVESGIDYKLPYSYKDFLKYKHFYNLRTADSYSPFSHVSIGWKERLYEKFYHSHLQPFMLDKGFIWFGDFEDWGFLCFDANKIQDKPFEYPIVLIDHEEPNESQLVYKNFEEYLIKNTILLT